MKERDFNNFEVRVKFVCFVLDISSVREWFPIEHTEKQKQLSLLQVFDENALINQKNLYGIVYTQLLFSTQKLATNPVW